MHPRQGSISRRGAGHAKRHQSGLTLLEFTLIVILIGLLAMVFLQRAVALRVSTEQAAVEQTVNAMRTGLALRVTELLVKDRRDELADLPGSNALELLRTDPILDGESALADGIELQESTVDADAIGPGDWAYDADTGEIIYRVEYNAAFYEAQPEGRWRIVQDGDTAGPSNIRLETTEPIDWP